MNFQLLLETHKNKLIWLTVLFFISLIIWLTFSPQGFITFFKGRNQLNAIEGENDIIEQQNKNLSEEIDKLKNDEKYFEDVARKKYGLIKKNEIIFDFDKKKK